MTAARWLFASAVLLAAPAGCVDRATGTSVSDGSGGASGEGPVDPGGDAGGSGGSHGATSTSGGSSTGAGSTTGGGWTAGDCGYLRCQAGTQCDPWMQDCRYDEKCNPWANDGGMEWNADKCVPLDPDPKAPGEPCFAPQGPVAGFDDCEKSAMCWNVDPTTNMGTCVAFCTGSPNMPSCADPTAVCTIANDGVLILCLPGCDPLLQDCGQGQTCAPTVDGSDFQCVLAVPEGGGPPGTPCELLGACWYGGMCMDAARVPGCTGDVGCCAPFCDLTDPEADATCLAAYETPGAACVPYFLDQPPAPGHENVGVCALPP